MPTNNPRVNVTLDPATNETLLRIAKEENKSVSSVIKELTLEALELREDLYLSKICR